MTGPHLRGHRDCGHRPDRARIRFGRGRYRDCGAEGVWRPVGENAYISNGGIADAYVIFVRTGEAPWPEVTERIE